jgi:hypothetical protein
MESKFTTNMTCVQVYDHYLGQAANSRIVEKGQGGIQPIQPMACLCKREQHNSPYTSLVAEHCNGELQPAGYNGQQNNGNQQKTTRKTQQSI